MTIHLELISKCIYDNGSYFPEGLEIFQSFFLHIYFFKKLNFNRIIIKKRDSKNRFYYYLRNDTRKGYHQNS